MFKKFLKEISKNNVFLIKPLKKSIILQNPVIFGYKKITDLNEYKFKYLAKLYKQKLKLAEILNKIKNNKKKLSELEYKILLKEIKFIYKKIDFLKNVYDFEANKIDSNYKILFPDLDYDYYNKAFFGVTKQDISNESKIKTDKNIYPKISKSELKELLDYSKKKIDGFKYKFGGFVFMSHSAGVLNIPSKKYYSLREVVTLFFHEMTHFFRRYNNIKNFGVSYGFNDYMKIEEGFSIYNEYIYGSKLIKGLEYSPFYEACFSVLIDKTKTEKEKIDGIYNILKHKGFDRKKSYYYYFRFNRYSSIGTNEFFLKDLVYTKGYKLVKKLIKNDSKIYEIIFSGKIGPNLLSEDLIKVSNNFDTKTYFEDILNEIKIKFKI